MNKKKRLENFVYGTQYYRAPTPLPEEWEDDLKNMGRAGLDTLQVRVQWRWNEPSEGCYRFDDIDRLFELSGKYKKKVIFKFLMECAPDYIFHKYYGHRKDMHGMPLNPGAIGAYYVGGWIPCFDNAMVICRAKEFTRIFVERYSMQENLLLWNIWNEPLSRPLGECGCEDSIKAYRKWLESEYKDIDSLNRKFGKSWESFGTVMPPAMPGDYAELFLWRLWAFDAVRKRLVFMYDAVREIDESRPVVSHVGGCSVIQDAAAGSSDDVRNAETVDFYGMSLPTAVHFENLLDEAQPFMICDWLRSASEYYWAYELYPDWGGWNRPVSLDDFRFKVWSVIASGAKGIMYWQYRAERLGNENNLAGLVNIDGSFKEITHESRRIKDFIDDNEKLLMEAGVKTDGVGILYSLESDLINRVENTRGGDFWAFDLAGGYPYLYKKALAGTYALFRELGIVPEWVDDRKLSKKIDSLKLLYIPECFIVNETLERVLKRFIERGGAVIAEEGLGLRQDNTWLNPAWPGGELGDLFGVSISERTSVSKEEHELEIAGCRIPVGGYVSRLEPNGSFAVGSWTGGSIGAVRKGKALFLGTSLGVSFYENFKTRRDDYLKALTSVLEDFGIACSLESTSGLYLRKLVSGENEIIFAFNRSGSYKEPSLGEDTEILREMTGAGEEGDNAIPPFEVRVYLCRKALKNKQREEMAFTGPEKERKEG